MPQNNVETSVVEPVKLLAKAMSKAAWQCVDCTGCSVIHLLASTVAVALFDVLFEFVVAVRVFFLCFFWRVTVAFFLIMRAANRIAMSPCLLQCRTLESLRRSFWRGRCNCQNRRALPNTCFQNANGVRTFFKTAQRVFMCWHSSPRC